MVVLHLTLALWHVLDQDLILSSLLPCIPQNWREFDCSLVTNSMQSEWSLETDLLIVLLHLCRNLTGLNPSGYGSVLGLNVRIHPFIFSGDLTKRRQRNQSPACLPAVQHIVVRLYCRSLGHYKTFHNCSGNHISGLRLEVGSHI